MGILERGGNAFDAASAGGFVLQVVEPHLNGPGGEVPILVYDCHIGEIEAICGQGVAPQAATVSHFRDLGLDMVPGTGLLRSEERRVGKECGSPCRSRGSPSHYKTKNN